MIWNNKRPFIYLRSFLIVTVVICSPLSLAFVIIISLDLMPLIPAISAWGGLIFISFIMVSILLNDLNRLKTIIDHFFDTDDLEPTGIHTRLIKNLVRSLQKLKRNNLETIKEIKKSYNGLEKALNALPGPVLLLGSNVVVIRANVAAKQLLGDEIEGRKLTTILRAPDLTKAIETLEIEGTQNVSFTLQSPIPRIFSAYLKPLPNVADDGTAIVVAILDVTASRKTNQMRADFVANASHEMRTPLATLSGFIQTLQGPAKNDPEAREKFLAIMSQHADRMAQLIDNLLSLSRIEMNEHTIPTDKVNISAILANVVNSLDWQAKERAILVEITLDDELEPLLGDESELTQLFYNLLDNSIKYSRENSVITIQAGFEFVVKDSRPNDQIGINISLRDEGEGIPREHLPRLTERFYRVDTARSRMLGGTGLGLAIVKHIANRHRAEFNITSELGKGSCFTLIFPLPSASAQKHIKRNAVEKLN